MDEVCGWQGTSQPRIVFPTVAQNTSPCTVLANFIEVLGRKIDNCEDVLDR